METNVANSAKSWFDLLTDAACVAVYVTVGTGVIAYKTVDECIIPGVQHAVNYAAQEGEKFCKEQIVPGINAARERGQRVVNPTPVK